MTAPITDWNEWRRNLTAEEIDQVLLDFGPPWIEGTCYPIKRFMLLHAIDPQIIKATLPSRRTPTGEVIQAPGMDES